MVGAKDMQVAIGQFSFQLRHRQNAEDRSGWHACSMTSFIVFVWFNMAILPQIGRSRHRENDAKSVPTAFAVCLVDDGSAVSERFSNPNYSPAALRFNVLYLLNLFSSQMTYTSSYYLLNNINFLHKSRSVHKSPALINHTQRSQRKALTPSSFHHLPRIYLREPYM